MLIVKANDINIKPIKYSPSIISKIPNPTSNKDNTIEIFDNKFNFFIYFSLSDIDHKSNLNPYPAPSYP
jgi:hypothetical protein